MESHAHTGFKQLWRGETTGSNNNELSKPVNAEVRAVDGLNAADLGFAVALRAGVTTVNVMTGSRSFASGQAVVLKMRGRTVEEMEVAPGGLKFAFFSGGGGLASTTRDYMRFCQMMLNGGELDGVRILSPTTVRMMSNNQLAADVAGLPEGVGFGRYPWRRGAVTSGVREGLSDFMM